jgi:hypothetical protein
MCKSKSDEAYEIFEKQAKNKSRNYVGSIVRDNLKILVGMGHSPEKAVKILWTQADRKR